MPSVKRFVEFFRTVAQKTGSIRDLRSLWPADCLLCLDPVRGTIVCDNCERLLPNSRRRCPRCALPMSEDRWCADCLRQPPAFDDVVTAFDYRFPIDRLVRRFKFSADLATGAYLGDALARAVATVALPDLVIASPASAARLQERGFNPALVLARRVASVPGIAVDSRVVAKIRHTPPQTGLDHAARRRNLRGAFVARRRLDGMHVAVVDDVMTTGTTLSALAAVLRNAGATRVSGWVVARTPEPPREG